MDRKALQADARDRLDDAKQTRALSEDDFREAYFFTAPHRLRPGRDNKSTTPPKDAEELQTSLGFEVSMDFGTVLLNTFCPETERWCELAAGPNQDPSQQEQIKAKCLKGTETIFTSIKSSNFYAEFAKSAFPDAGIGNMAMWITEDGMSRPPGCLAASLREIYITLGPKGEIDDRFVCRQTRYRYLPALIPDVTFPEKIQKKIDKNGKEKCEVTWGYWRLWAEKDECWQHVVMVNDEIVHDAELTGEGSCPLVIGRFNATSDSPWGYGPTIMSLADLRQADELAALKIEGIDFQTRPPIGYPDDSMAALENGIEPGMAYPVRPGGAADIKELFKPGQIDGVLYETNIVEERVRRLHFSDSPTQRGKTPPSATQWAGEIVIAQRRIGTPGKSFWAEFCAGVFRRFKYILEKRGTLETIKVNGNDIAVHPVNPAQRAADALEVQNAIQLIQIGSGAFPEEWRIRIDGGKTIDKLKEKLGDTLVQFRSESDIKLAVSQISQLTGAAAPGNMGGDPNAQGQA